MRMTTVATEVEGTTLRTQRPAPPFTSSRYDGIFIEDDDKDQDEDEDVTMTQPGTMSLLVIWRFGSELVTSSRRQC